jgi:hypothetical protein
MGLIFKDDWLDGSSGIDQSIVDRMMQYVDNSQDLKWSVVQRGFLGEWHRQPKGFSDQKLHIYDERKAG